MDLTFLSSLPQTHVVPIRIPHTFQNFSYLLTLVLSRQNEGELHTAQTVHIEIMLECKQYRMETV